MRRWGGSLLAGLVLVLLAGLLLPLTLVKAAGPATVYFPETGHNVGAPFLEYWRTRGGLAAYGYPLTEAFTEVSPTDGKPYTVQYFERARFEDHPENSGEWRVLLGHLGRTMGDRVANQKPFNPVSAGQAEAGAVYFPESQHTVKKGFLAYWNANGGLPRFGYPISEEFQEKSSTDGKVYTVQYFERHRFEYHPENAAPYDVLLGLLGRQIGLERGLRFDAAARLEGVPDYDEQLFYTPTPVPTATPVPPPPTPEPPPPPPSTGGPRPDLGRTYIEVDLTEQHLYAWEGGEIVFDIAISSGKPSWETPAGTFYVNSMYAVQDMRGPDPDLPEGEYFQPEVPWIMYFTGEGHAIHGVYWHSNFGIRATSHGCVGAPVWAAKWLYDWGYIGLPIWIHR